MALQDAASLPHVTNMLDHLTGDVRLAAFEAGNQTLASEVEALKSNPRRIRKLTVDAASEALIWIDDPAVIEAIVEVEPRHAVLDKARDRMRQLSADLTVTANSKNVTDRTRRAVAKSPTEAIEALNSMSVVSMAVTHEWLTGLDGDDLTSALVMAIKHPAIQSAEFLGELIADTIHRLGTTGAASLIETAAASHLAGSVINAWPHELNEAIAPVFAQSVISLHDLQPRPYTAEAASVWRHMNRTDLLFWADAVDQAEIPHVIETLVREKHHYEVINAITASSNPRTADAVVREMKRLGMLNQNESPYGHPYAHLTSLLRLNGLADATVSELLLLGVTEEVMSFLVSDVASDEHRKIAAETHDADEFIRAIRYLDNQDAADVGRLVDALYDFSRTLPQNERARRYYWYRTEALSKHVAERTAALLGSSRTAWQTFWSLYQNAESATYLELAQAALALEG
jgi:hypothetical protein